MGDIINLKDVKNARVVKAWEQKMVEEGYTIIPRDPAVDAELMAALDAKLAELEASGVMPPYPVEP